jgi:putative ABC transport system substrate-binding protein
MGAVMRRRQFLRFVGGVVGAWPQVVRGQQAVKRIGMLLPAFETDPEWQSRVGALRVGLQELGWIENRNYRFEYRWPGIDPERLKISAVQLAASTPDIIVSGSALGARLLRAETNSIPIVFVNVADPVGGGLVSSLAKTGGNITGFTAFEYKTSGKWLELLKEIAPRTATVGVAFGGAETGPTGEGFYRALQAIAPSFSVHLTAIRLSNAADVEPAIDKFARQSDTGLIAAAEAGASNNRGAIIRAVARHRMPAVYPFRYFAAEGGLAVYGVDISDQYRRSASYVDRILKGADPANLPVQAPDRFQLIINVKTATSLGIAISPALLVRADEVIE